MKKLLLALLLIAAPVVAQQATPPGQFNFNFTQQLVWGAVTEGKYTCQVGTAVCSIPAVANVAATATIAVIGGTAPYTWTATGLPKGVTLGTSTGLTNTIILAASATDPCPATGTCFTIVVTDSSITSQTVTLTLGKDQTQVAVIVPATMVNVNGQFIATN